MKEIIIKGFTSDLTPGDKPTVSIFGEEGSGKSRLAATAEDVIGLLALDRKSKRTFQAVANQLGKQIIVQKEDYVKPKEMIKLSMLDSSTDSGLKEIKKVYSELVKAVMDDAMRLAEHPAVNTIAVDSCSQFWDWIMFSHFGRRNQIESFMRGAPNQDLIDFINALKHKNLILIHRAAEIWKNTGEIDSKGRPKQAPSGKFKAEGCSKLGYLITCELEMVSKAKAADLDEKFHVKVRECQINPLIEGQDLEEYGVTGESINWDNIMTAIGWNE